MMLQPNEHTGSRRMFTKTILVTCKPSVIRALQIVLVINLSNTLDITEVTETGLKSFGCFGDETFGCDILPD